MIYVGIYIRWCWSYGFQWPLLNKNAFGLLKKNDSGITVTDSSNVTVSGNMVITAGVLTGIEGALKIVGEICGNELKEKVKENLYY